jgi:hypothetical protein
MNERREELGVVNRAPIPAAWERVVAVCLAKDAIQRPPSGAALLQLLNTPAHALVPYQTRAGIPLETLKLNVTPVKRVPQARQAEIVEAEAYEVPETSWRDGFLFSVVRGTASVFGDLFDILYLWARRLVFAAIAVAAIVVFFYIVQRLPKADPKPAAAPVAQAQPTPFTAPLQPAHNLQYAPAQPGWPPPPPGALDRPPPPPHHGGPPPRGRR